MKYIKNNLIGLLLVFFVIFCENIHLLFRGIEFERYYDNDGVLTVVMLDDAVYYLINQICQVTLIPAIIILYLVDNTKIAQMLLIGGVIAWNIKEVIDEVCYISRINKEVYWISTGQLVFIFSILFFSAYGYSRWKR